MLFVSLALITGIIWGPAGVEHLVDWEPRLTTTLILWLIYVSYLMIRSYAPSQDKAARYSAVVGIIGFVDVPIVYYSVVWWRSIHPSPVVGPFAESGALEPIMQVTLLFSLITFLVLFAFLVWERASLCGTARTNWEKCAWRRDGPADMRNDVAPRGMKE